MNQEKIGKFIAECRKDRKLTQQELSEKLGVSDRTIGNWENGRNMPDLSLFKPLCKELHITINDLMSGKIVDKKEYQNKLEENIINTIVYTNQKIENRNNLIGILLIIFGVLISITAMTIFPSESSWGSIYSIFGTIVLLVGICRLTKILSIGKRIICCISFFLLFIMLLVLIDYIGVINIHQGPRFSIVKVSGDKMVYYDTPFYDVIRCNIQEKNEIFKVISNQKYDRDKIDYYCK